MAPSELSLTSLRSTLRYISRESADYTLTLTKPKPHTPSQTAVDGDRSWLSESEKQEFNEAGPILKTLLSKGSKPITHSTYKLQKDDADTCGRWAAARVMLADLPLTEFVKRMTGGAGTPDQQVTSFTNASL